MNPNTTEPKINYRPNRRLYLNKCRNTVRFCTSPRTSNYGRPFFVCSDQANPCSFWVWGDVQAVAKPKCRHGFPSVIRKVKKETVNKDRLFFCCAQEDSCNYFEWVPEEIKQHDKREEQYSTEDFIDDLAKLKSYF